ncbi:MAG: PIG-L family deacetylase [Anaerolineales bacterium]
MRWIFLSPHYDDAVFSCGGGIWELRQGGEEIEVWTICGGQPQPQAAFSPYVQELHQRWGFGIEAVSMRQAEDSEALSRLGIRGISLSIPDCIYRLSPTAQPLYASDEALFDQIHPLEWQLVHQLSEQIARMLSGKVQLICPLGVGNHVDHRLTRLAAEASGLPLRYYAEIPYIFRYPEWQKEYLYPEFSVTSIPISQKGLEQWLLAASAYRSQISTFWESEEHLRKAFTAHWQTNPTLQLWQATTLPAGSLTVASG